MTGLRVVMLLSNGLSSDPRVEKEATALAGAGCEVTVVAWDRGGALPEREERDGYVIERVGPAAVHGGGLRNIGRYRTYWSLAAARASALAPDVVHCHDMDTVIAGMRIIRRVVKRPALVLDFHELYRESNMIPQRGFAGVIVRAVVRTLELRALRAADAVLVANPGTTSYYADLGAGEKLVTIENAPDAGMFAPSERPRPQRDFTIGFMGQKRYLAGLTTLIDVVAATPGLAALLAGGGTAADAVARYAADVSRVEVSGPFTYAQLPALYARCDAIHAVYDVRLGNVRSLFPVKMMEAMACGLPVVVARGTWAGDYAERTGVGLSVVPDDVASLAGALARLKDDPAASAEMGRRGRALVEAGLNWATVSDRLIATYERLAD